MYKYLVLLSRSAVLYRLTMFAYYKAFLKLDHHTRDFPGTKRAYSCFCIIVLLGYGVFN